LLDACPNVAKSDEWKEFLGTAAELRPLYAGGFDKDEEVGVRLHQELCETRGDRTSVLGLLPKHFLRRNWNLDDLKMVLDALKCENVEARTILLSCFEDREDSLASSSDSLQNLLLQATASRRPNDTDFDTRCVERGQRLLKEEDSSARRHLLGHFIESCSSPIQGEESPIRAAQELRFGAEVKAAFDVDLKTSTVEELVVMCSKLSQFKCVLRLAEAFPPDDSDPFATSVYEQAMSSTDAEVIVAVMEAVTANVEKSMWEGAVERCLQLDRPDEAFKLCLMPADSPLSAKAIKVARLLTSGDSLVPFVKSKGSFALRHLEAAPVYSEICAAIIADREEYIAASEEDSSASSVASRFLRRVFKGVPASLNVLSINVIEEQEE
jgi:hypothetical protein